MAEVLLQKRKIADEHGIFQEKWTDAYLRVQFNKKTVLFVMKKIQQ
jgi:hypothetical protein